MKRIEKSMISGRKIFRFLKFIQDLNKLFLYGQKSFSVSRILKICMLISAMFYHILDSILWCHNIGLIGQFM